ncbi:unnamed protein product [Paramecium sonneborni]|uniref:MORN repeat protein n=1 Tax=Paramecium sonneborni TaxID=65129 RepID=A0A8S1R8T5_9CILI|nr:unnamed protein product [Paramecium sonneborni]
MGNCQCQSADIQKTEEMQPLEYKQENITSFEDHQLQFCLAQQIQQQETIKSNNETSDDTHRPNPQVVWQTSTQFTTSNNVVEKLLDELGTYEIEDEEGHFYGVYEQKDGSLYRGCWYQSEKFGYGCLIYQDGSVFQGQWRRDRANGKGRMIYADGDWYEGDWVDDLSQITVIFQSMETENMYILMEPSMKENGRMIFRMVMDKNNLLMDLNIWDSLRMVKRMDLANIFGLMARNMKGILNLIIFVDLGIKSSILSIRKYVWSDGRQYEGEWLNGSMDGNGIMNWPDGRKYEGQYSNDKKHGQGVLGWRNLVADGRKYSGQWEFGKQHGIGEYFNGQINKKGQWNQGKRLKWLD